MGIDTSNDRDILKQLVSIGGTRSYVEISHSKVLLLIRKGKKGTMVLLTPVPFEWYEVFIPLDNLFLYKDRNSTILYQATIVLLANSTKVTVYEYER